MFGIYNCIIQNRRSQHVFDMASEVYVMKRMLVLAVMIMVLGSGFCGGILMNAQADDHVGYEPVIFYKSIEIQEGDTLWGIAEEYAPELDLKTAEYVEQLKQMNSLREDTIHAGCHLTVMYSGAVG